MYGTIQSGTIPLNSMIWGIEAFEQSMLANQISFPTPGSIWADSGTELR
jgi:hypothetical protein